MVADTETVADIAVHLPGAARVFEARRIDYCCAGGSTLRDACVRAHVAVEDVVAELDALGARKPPSWSSPGGLVAHIIEHHHAYARAAMDRLAPLARKVQRAHGEKHPELARVVELFDSIVSELAPHLRAEEGALFPAILLMAQPACTGQRRAALRASVLVMQHDHDQLGRTLALLRATTGDYRPPEDACTSFRVLYAELEALEADLHEHIHLENNVLLPQALGSPR